MPTRQPPAWLSCVCHSARLREYLEATATRDRVEMVEIKRRVGLPALQFPSPVRAIVARAYCPRGTYWRQPFVRPDAAYVNEEDLIWTATTFDDK
jgi:hypothetical protein